MFAELMRGMSRASVPAPSPRSLLRSMLRPGRAPSASGKALAEIGHRPAPRISGLRLLPKLFQLRLADDSIHCRFREINEVASDYWVRRDPTRHLLRQRRARMAARGR